jgi:hypothetical protein
VGAGGWQKCAVQRVACSGCGLELPGLRAMEEPGATQHAGEIGEEELQCTQRPPPPLGPRLEHDGVVLFKLQGDPGATAALGRQLDADVVLPADATRVSRLHAELRLERDGWFLWDSKSSLGTTLNGDTVYPGRAAELFDGDIIRLGEGNIPEERAEWVTGDAVEIIVKGLSKQRTAATETRDAAARSNFNSVERNYVKKCIKAMEMGLERAKQAAADGNFDNVWKAAGGAYEGMGRARDDFCLRGLKDERERAYMHNSAARRQARHYNHDSHRGKATARQRNDKKKKGGAKGGASGGGVHKNSSKGQRRGGGGGGGFGGGERRSVRMG